MSRHCAYASRLRHKKKHLVRVRKLIMVWIKIPVLVTAKLAGSGPTSFQKNNELIALSIAGVRSKTKSSVQATPALFCSAAKFCIFFRIFIGLSEIGSSYWLQKCR